MSVDFTCDEKDRFSSRLSTIPGIRPLPSVGDWILLEVTKPQEIARKVNRRLEPGIMSVPRGMDGAVRAHAGGPKINAQVRRTRRHRAACAPPPSRGPDGLLDGVGSDLRAGGGEAGARPVRHSCDAGPGAAASPGWGTNRGRPMTACRA